jgi:hypothetical protein
MRLSVEIPERWLRIPGAPSIDAYAVGDLTVRVELLADIDPPAPSWLAWRVGGAAIEIAERAESRAGWPLERVQLTDGTIAVAVSCLELTVLLTTRCAPAPERARAIAELTAVAEQIDLVPELCAIAELWVGFDELMK